MMKTEKRKANVGERILITGAFSTGGRYANGDIRTVYDSFSAGIFITEHGVGLFHSEYEVIVETPPAPKKSERISALETEVATLKAKVEALEAAGKYPNTARFERESAEVDEIVADIKRKAKPSLEALLATYPTPEKSKNEQRADVIKRAKAFVAEHTQKNALSGGIEGIEFGRAVCDVEFIVNKEKRAVTLLAKGVNSGTVHNRGIAKCDPSDVFNADIGKAIALGRALGVGVAEFTKAVQPTEVVVGQVVKFFAYNGREFAPARIEKVTNGNEVIVEGLGRSYFAPQKTGDVITDDTDAEY